MEVNFYDAQQALGFINPQLLSITAEIDKQEYPSWDYSRLMQVDTSGGMWSVGSVFFSGDIAGAVSFLSHAGFDMPYADISRTQFLQQNYFAGIGYQWQLGELKRAEQLGQNLSSEKADAARQVAESFVYGMAIRGSTEKNLTGLINDPLVPAAAVPADGTGASSLFSAKTAALINRDVNAVLNAPFNATLETKRANTLLLPTTRLQALASAQFSAGSDVTVLAFIKANNAYTLETGQPLTIVGTRELETAGAGGTARMMAYDNSPSVVKMHLPGPHEFLPAWQKSSMTWEVAGIMNVGGVEFRRPKGAAYRDGI